MATPYGPRSRWYLVVALLSVAGCGGAGAERTESTTTTPLRPTTTTTTLLPATTTTTLVSIPADPVVAECQTVVNAALTEWTFDDDLDTVTRCVPPDGLDGHSGRYSDDLAIVNAQLPDQFVGEVRARTFRSIAAHELGHSWSDHNVTSTQRTDYMAIRGYSGTWQGSNANEDYADVFALLNSGLADETITAYVGTPGILNAELRERPTADQIAAICGAKLMPC